MSQDNKDLTTVRLPLLYSLTTAAGEKLSSVPLKRLKRKDIAAAQKHSKDQAVIEDLLVAQMTGLTVEDLGELDIADSRRVTEVFQELVRGGDVAAFVGRITAAGAEATAE